MSDFVESLLSKEFATRATQFVGSLDTADPRFMAIIVAFLVFVGLKMTGSQPTLRAWGLRLGLVTFLLFAAYSYYVEGKSASKDLFDVGLRSANAGGTVLALIWIVLPIATFIYSHLRLALAAFLGYGAYGVITAPDLDNEQIFSIVLRAMLAVGLTLVAAWIVHPIWDFIKDQLPKSSPRPAEDKPAKRPTKERLFARLRRKARRRAQAEAVVPVAPPLAAAVADSSATDQRRRDRARLKVEILFALALPDLEARIPRPVFNDLVVRYLGDHLPASEVEENSCQFELLFQQRQALRFAPVSAETERLRVVDTLPFFPVSTVLDLPQLQPVEETNPR